MRIVKLELTLKLRGWNREECREHGHSPGEYDAETALEIIDMESLVGAVEDTLGHPDELSGYLSDGDNMVAVSSYKLRLTPDPKGR